MGTLKKDKKLHKFIDFIITENCTYNCIYCSQSKVFKEYKKNADKNIVESFLLFLDKIPNDFEITITGGEAILHPDFYYLINEIKKKDFKINLITNLSFPIEVYRGIFNILGENLNKFDISAHLDEIKDFNDFLDKFDEFIKFKPQNCTATLFIPVFKLNKDKKDKIRRLVHLAQSNSVKSQYQRIRFLDNYIPLDEVEKNLLKNEKLTKTYSKYCNSGFLSCIIYPDGNAYRCYGSRFKKSSYLGNISNYDFKLKNKCSVCASKYCMCDKPIKYGQLTSKKSLFAALGTTLSDILNLPVLIIKNKELIKTKIKQYKNLKKIKP